MSSIDTSLPSAPVPVAQPRALSSPRTASVEFLRSQSRGAWAVTVILLFVAALGAHSVVTNENFQWGVVGSYLFDSRIMRGLLMTLELTALASLIGFVLGTILAIMRLSHAPLAVWASRLYVWMFRGTPLLVQLVFWFNLAALYRWIGFGVPFGPTFWRADTNDVITPFAAAILGLGLNAAAYMSEIVRAGIQSIPHGQPEAAQALGLRRRQTLWHIVLPQAMRVIVPPASNEVISMLKYSALVSVIAVPELLYSARLIYARTFETIPLLIVVSLWYLAVTTVLTIIQHYLEKRFGRGVKRTPAPASRAV